MTPNADRCRRRRPMRRPVSAPRSLESVELGRRPEDVEAVALAGASERLDARRRRRGASRAPRRAELDEEALEAARRHRPDRPRLGRGDQVGVRYSVWQEDEVAGARFQDALADEEARLAVQEQELLVVAMVH